jgi:hypothetical protein
VIPPKSNRTKAIRYSKRLYRERNCIERVLGHLKINRAIATRYDQLAESFLGMLFIASARYWIKFVHDLALLWQIVRWVGFPNQAFSDSWVVGFWRADHDGHNFGVG